MLGCLKMNYLFLVLHNSKLEVPLFYGLSFSSYQIWTQDDRLKIANVTSVLCCPSLPEELKLKLSGTALLVQVAFWLGWSFLFNLNCFHNGHGVRSSFNSLNKTLLTPPGTQTRLGGISSSIWEPINPACTDGGFLFICCIMVAWL